MAKTPRSAHHRIYLLSVWREQDDGKPNSVKLRFSLEDPRSGERLVYTSLEKLLAELNRTLLDSLGDIKM